MDDDKYDADSGEMEVDEDITDGKPNFPAVSITRQKKFEVNIFSLQI
jgi:hypothetical protein